MVASIQRMLLRPLFERLGGLEVPVRRKPENAKRPWHQPDARFSGALPPAMRKHQGMSRRALQQRYSGRHILSFLWPLLGQLRDKAPLVPAANRIYASLKRQAIVISGGVEGWILSGSGPSICHRYMGTRHNILIFPRRRSRKHWRLPLGHKVRPQARSRVPLWLRA